MERSLGIPLLNHDTALERRHKLGPERWSARYKFALVRNPYDRMVSSFFHTKRANGRGPGDDAPDFATWLQWIGRSIESGTLFDKFKLPQAFWVCDASGNIIVDDLWKLESIRVDIPTLEEKLGRSVALPHIKRGADATDYKTFYGPVEREIMKLHFARDFELLGYDFL